MVYEQHTTRKRSKRLESCATLHLRMRNASCTVSNQPCTSLALFVGLLGQMTWRTNSANVLAICVTQHACCNFAVPESQASFEAVDALRYVVGCKPSYKSLPTSAVLICWSIMTSMAQQGHFAHGLVLCRWPASTRSSLAGRSCQGMSGYAVLIE